MNELIRITTNDQQQPIVSGRELHEFLDVGTEYRHWFPRMAEYGFAEGADYTPVISDHPQNGQPFIDHAVTLDMAKEIAMIQRTDRGKRARQYFIQVEKDFNSPEKVMARALVIADHTIKSLTAKIEEQKPMVMFAETCLTSKECVLVREVAKIACKQGIEIGEKRLWQKLRDWGLVLAGSTEPSQHAMTNGWFEVKQVPIDTAYNTLLRTTTKVTPKGQVYIIERLRKSAAN